MDSKAIYLDAPFVVACFEDASATLRALPYSGYSTALSQPQREVVNEFIEAYGYTDAENRPTVPEAAKIDAMDSIFRWLTLIPDGNRKLRRIIALRSFTRPDGSPVSWKSIGRRLNFDDRAVKRWHAQAIGIIVRELNRIEAEKSF